jgi:hypothetical protein|tara:strand:+ start:6485 stop:6712 length:228 start_codon:yes stop_codon:yes gene_type:complete
MEIITFAKEFCDLLQHDGKILTAASDIRAHIDEIWMEDVLEFGAESNYKLVDIDINVSTYNKKPFVVALYKLKPR